MPRWPLSALLLAAALVFAGCASYGGRGLQPGVDGVAEVVAVMGEPALRWRDPDGSEQLAFPRGPAGVHTFMAHFGPDGRLQRIVNVLDTAQFARLQPGRDDQASVLRLFGPPVPQWTVYYEARDELVWEWRYCDSWREAARFDVLFDGTKKTVRSTMSWTESSKSHFRVSC
jgi:hypothetical protein